jgi:hypothetical protein
MKIALLNDSHFGCRNDSPHFMEYQNRFFDELFFPYLEENNIRHLVHLGDVVDRRKFINYRIAHNFQEKFWKRLWDMKIDTHIIIGNHDTYYKNTNSVNAMQQLVTTSDGKFEPWIYEKPTTIIFDKLPILLVPWICDDIYDESIKTIQNSQAQICFGHLNIKGFEMHKGHYNDHGLEKNLFKRFEKVISGHFHKKSDDGQIYYLGTQYQITWNDYQCPKGFHVFDTETRELERIANPVSIFKKIYYDDHKEYYTEKNISEYDNTYLKLFVVNKSKNKMFEDFINRLHTDIDLHELNIIDEDTSNITSSVREDILDHGEDTLTFLGNYVEQIDTELDRKKLKEFISDLYKEAQE